MARLGELVNRVRSKNAGPFTVTVDVFCESRDEFENVSKLVSDDAVASLFQTPVELVRRYELPAINVIKFSFARPSVQGSRLDRDMHAAQFAVLLEEMEISTY